MVLKKIISTNKELDCSSSYSEKIYVGVGKMGDTLFGVSDIGH